MFAAISGMGRSLLSCDDCARTETPRSAVRVEFVFTIPFTRSGPGGYNHHNLFLILIPIYMYVCLFYINVNRCSRFRLSLSPIFPLRKINNACFCAVYQLFRIILPYFYMVFSPILIMSFLIARPHLCVSVTAVIFGLCCPSLIQQKSPDRSQGFGKSFDL